jgi:hypothetical protein
LFHELSPNAHLPEKQRFGTTTQQFIEGLKHLFYKLSGIGLTMRAGCCYIFNQMLLSLCAVSGVFLTEEAEGLSRTEIFASVLHIPPRPHP